MTLAPVEVVRNIKSAMGNNSMKTLKFKHHLVEGIIAGKKIATWRLFDDKDLRVGDQLELIDVQTKEKFAQAEITGVKEKKLGELVENDFEGHEKYKNRADMLKHYREYYGNGVTLNTIVKIINFKLFK